MKKIALKIGILMASLNAMAYSHPILSAKTFMCNIKTDKGVKDVVRVILVENGKEVMGNKIQRNGGDITIDTPSSKIYCYEKVSAGMSNLDLDTFKSIVKSAPREVVDSPEFCVLHYQAFQDYDEKGPNSTVLIDKNNYKSLNPNELNNWREVLTDIHIEFSKLSEKEYSIFVNDKRLLPDVIDSLYTPYRPRHEMQYSGKCSEVSGNQQ